MTNKATGRTELTLVSEKQAAQMGAEAAKQTVAEVGLVEDAALQQWVQQLGTTLAQKSERPDIPFKFQVVNDASVNAFALPGGFIFVTRGILAHLDTEAELATVLGHEIAHVTAAHSISQISRQQLLGLGLGVGVALKPDLAPYAQIAQAGLGILLLKYGRDAEREADELGFRYASKANYDPAAAVGLFEMLGQVGGGAEGRLPSWLSTHPAPEERLVAAKKRVAEAKGALPQGGDDRPAYLRRLEGLPFGDDPRDGYFEGRTFIQPQMRLSLEFPEGWKTQDTAQAVQGVEPNGNAAVVLAATQEASPEAAMQKFAALEGITASQATVAPVNDLPAASSRFTARTEEGSVAGLVTFVKLGERTFQLVGYAKAEGFAQYEPALRAALGSFRTVTDERLLSPKASRIRIVALPEAMSLAEFHRRQPSSVSLEALAALNGVKPDARLEQGHLVKQVVTE